MAQLFVNNLTLTLAANATTSQLTLNVVSTTGLPVFNVGDWFYLTLTDIREGGELRWEIVKVTSWTGTTLTVVRGQDGTTAQAWSAGAKASLRVTAADMAGLAAAITPAQLLTAIKTVDGSGSGLDADTLDDLNSNQFVRSDTGGTYAINITGNATTATNADTLDGKHASEFAAYSSIYGFKNHIINGNFVIWQRGTSFTNIHYAYTADRWQSHDPESNRSITKQTENNIPFLRLSTNGNSYGIVWQKVENQERLASKTVTMSVTFKTTLGNTVRLGYSIYQVGDHAAQNFTATGSKQTETLTFTMPSSTNDQNNFYVSILNNGNLDLYQVQLEEGSVATPFEQRPIGLEWSLCQRYYSKIALVALNFPAYIAGAVNSWILKLPVTMRSVPTIAHNLNQSGSYAASGAWDIGFTDVTSASQDLVRVITRSTTQIENAYATFNTSVAFISTSAEI